MADREDPPHPIIDRPFEYQVVAVHWTRESSESNQSSLLDLTLRKGTVTRRLRFLDPTKVLIHEGFPGINSGMYIADVSGRGLEGLRVRVGNFEATPGTLTFWAAEVIDLDARSV